MLEINKAFIDFCQHSQAGVDWKKMQIGKNLVQIAIRETTRENSKVEILTFTLILSFKTFRGANEYCSCLEMRLPSASNFEDFKKLYDFLNGTLSYCIII
jgi:hypothetical protein